MPSSGVYAGFVYVDDTFYGAMINVGNNPTFENKKVSIEAHIFDFDQDIYERNVRFFFLKKTRNEIRFDGFEALKIMAKEYIELEPGNEYGVISLNKTVFSTIAKNVIEEDENVQIAEGTKPFKTGIVTRVEDNKLTLSIPVKVNHKSNVSDVCLNLQNKIFESISYMT